LSSQAQDLVQVVAVFKLEQGADTNTHSRSVAPVRSQLSAPSSGRSEASSAGINLDNAIKAHADWRSKLRAAANNSEQLDAETIARDDCCELGKWLHGAGGSKFGGKPTFVSLIGGHKKFHIEAGKVARVVNQGAGEQAVNMLGSGTPFAIASGEVSRIIVQLKKELSGVSKTPSRQTIPKLVAVAPPSGGNDDWETF
jgi:hypothetical protein